MASRRINLVRHKIIHSNIRPIISKDGFTIGNVCTSFSTRKNFSTSTSSNIDFDRAIMKKDDHKDSMNLKRREMFIEEQKRQKDLIPRVEKIQIHYEGIPENMQLLLNKGISTPLDIAKHISEDLVERSALAVVNGELWDMGRPLEDDCTVELMHFHVEEPKHVNRAFWRSCSFLMGAALEMVFKDEANVLLHSFPGPNVSSGSFVYDVEMNMKDWNPTKEELMTISAAMHRLSEQHLPFERLVVDASLAKEMFEDNKHKANQIPDIAAKSKSGHSVTLYKIGNHVDISGGPMVGDTSFLGRRCTIAAAHKIVRHDLPLYRFQGIALPKGIFLGHFPFGILEKRAAILNETNYFSAQPVNPT